MYAAGLGDDAPPAGFVFPTEGDYLQGLVLATSAMAPTVGASPGSSISVPPPVQVQIAGLQATLESATGMPLGELSNVALSIVDLANATSPVQVASAIEDLLGGSIEIAVAIAEAVGAAASVINTIPLLGAIVKAVAGFITGALKAEYEYAKATQKCQERIDQKVDAMCGNLINQARPYPTGEKGVTPADMFRPLAYRWQSNSLLPLSPASIYVALCVDQVQEWPRIAGLMEHHKEPNKIPKQVKRQMWTLIRGLMQTVRPPVLGAGMAGKWVPTDHGRSLFPILQGIVLQQLTLGNITENYMEQAGRYVASAYRIGEDCPDLVPSGPYAGAMPYGAGACSTRVNLFQGFKEGLLQYEAQLVHCFKEDWGWRTSPKPGVGCGVATGGVRGILTMDAKTSKQLALAVQSASGGGFRSLKGWQKSLLVAGTLGAGALGFETVRGLT